MTFDQNAKTVITTIISMARSLGNVTTAEGVEYEEQKEFLSAQGCEQMQGYLYSKPLKQDQLEDLLKKEKNDKRLQEKRNPFS